jgi:DNA invertase Pin-like site-specific DNA recombinase
MQVFLYGRHSTDKQSATEDVQRAACEAYFEHTLQPKGAALAGWFYDAAVSGGKPFAERPEGVRVWLSAQPGDVIVVSKLDRAFRSLIDGANCVEAMKQRGVHFASLDLGLDTSTPMGEFALHIFLAAAQLQRRYTSERTREVLALKAERGQPIGRAAASSPYGWRRVGRGKGSHLTSDEGERARIDEMAEWRESGLSLEQISFRAAPLGVEGRRSWYPSSVSAALEARSLGFPRAFMRSRRRVAQAITAEPLRRPAE